MKNTIITIFGCIGLAFCPTLFDGDQHYDMVRYCRDMQVSLWVAFSFHAISQRNIICRSLILIFLLYTVIESNVYLLYYIFGYDVYSIAWYIFTFSTLICIAYNAMKTYDYKSDKITDPKKIYFCFWKPKKVLPLFASIFAAPFGGMSIYTNGTLYGFKWKEESYLARNVPKKAVMKKFFVLDTGIYSNDIILHKLKMLIGKRAGFLRTRCISTIKPVLKEMGPQFEPSLINSPSQYALKMIKGSRC